LRTVYNVLTGPASPLFLFGRFGTVFDAWSSGVYLCFRQFPPEPSSFFSCIEDSPFIFLNTDTLLSSAFRCSLDIELWYQVSPARSPQRTEQPFWLAQLCLAQQSFLFKIFPNHHSARFATQRKGKFPVVSLVRHNRNCVRKITREVFAAVFAPSALRSTGVCCW
jgi:hypothetical protein